MQTAPLSPERQALLNAYHRLAPPERTVVNLLAVNWGSLAKTQIQTSLRKLLGLEKVKALKLDALVKSGVLVAVKDWNGQRLRCNPLIMELVARQLVLDGAFNGYVDLAHIAAPLQKSYLRQGQDEYVFRNEEELIREVRLGMYWRDEAYIASLYRMLEAQSFGYYSGFAQHWSDPASVYALVCANPFDAEWFSGLPAGIRLSALPRALSWLSSDWRCDEVARALLLEGCRDPLAAASWLDMAVLLAIFRGEWGEAEALLARMRQDGNERARRALLALLRGQMDEAVGLFREGLALLRKEQRSRKAYFSGVAGLFFILALQQRGAAGDAAEAQKLIAQVPDGSPFGLAYMLLACVGLWETNEQHAQVQFNIVLGQALKAPEPPPWIFWVGMSLLCRYQGAAGLAPHAAAMEACRKKAQEAGFAWLSAEMAGLLGRVPGWEAAKEQAAAFEAGAGVRLLAGRIQYEEPWERALNAIANTVARPGGRDGKAEPGEIRLAWYVAKDRYARGGYDIEIREQGRNAKGGWSKGKVVSPKRLRDNIKDYASATDQDARAAKHIAQDYATGAYYLGEKGWLALVGHPHVFWKDNGMPLEMNLSEPELRIKKKSKTDLVRIEFWPLPGEGEKDVLLAADGLTRLKVIELKPEHRRLAAIIGEGLEAPQAAQERILQSLSAVSSLVTIHSDIGASELAAAESVEADPSPRVQLVPEGAGLRIALLVRPFGEQGPYYPPGVGGAGLIAEIGGKRLQARREPKRERQLAAEVLELCPSLGGKAEEVEKWQWLAEDAETSLEVLLELHELGGKAAVEWPQGQKFKLLGQAGLGSFSLKLQQQRDWFSVGGELRLDSGEVLNMQRLLELTAGGKSRFVQLDENRFLALTDAFRKRLDDLRGYAEKHGKDLRVNPLALPALEEIASEVGEFQADAAWRRQVEKLRQAEQFQPRVPSTLQAELRDYQLEGFNWLSRLAAWGVGACLADDMGLGKTLQAIALILSRAGEGPTLVVAPTSVCFNWQNELDRFAPTLSVKTLGTGDRQQLVEGLQPYDLLICSYGLLQQEAVGELLASAQFRTIVLDEAQAIKNPATKRSQQAMALQGEFKLITTGTPLENHLGELWNLFRFINPGLLGSLESFNQRFAGPIERGEDREAKHRLKRMIQPFILRRTKAQVLDELPPRTEIELQVELSEKEASFYEALRRRLLEEINTQGGPVEDQRFKVLAAITKLRRACCNPGLVAPELGLASSKLELFGEVLDELLENRHKALVFSQFVDHLGLIRAHLDGKGVSYQYLDGQTPAPERKRRVEAFQAGQGDVFLISLKAGGVGLNLTAADYVIHMDPWWNPAVEDQASDRAHRIGQQRPVTVYRLVAKGTIEEQIVSLHRHKRDLADSLLEGGELSAKVGAEDLLRLMRGG